MKMGLGHLDVLITYNRDRHYCIFHKAVYDLILGSGRNFLTKQFESDFTRTYAPPTNAVSRSLRDEKFVHQAQKWGK
jgi:hypothetical protein